jgi:hypothetical protein
MFLHDMIYTPCPERQTFRNPEPFLPGEPTDLIKAGRFKKMPFIVGANTHDAASFIVREYTARTCLEPDEVYLNLQAAVGG